MKIYRTATVVAALAILVAGCDSDGKQSGNIIVMDGSNTVYPLSGALGEEFQAQTGNNLTIGVSGTGGGFQSFCRGETDITGASRPIRDSELEQCEESGVDFIEIPVAYDGVTVAIHPDNDWAQSMTIDELKMLWEPAAQGEITHWNQIRDDWPEERISLFGNTTDNGTYDYFTQAVVGEQHTSRGDYTASVDSNVLVQGISSDPNALGFFAYAYFYENQNAVQSVAIKTDDDAEGVHPDFDTINDGSYQPLARPMFYYISTDGAGREEIQQFVEFIFDDAGSLIESVGYVPLPEETYELAARRFDRQVVGTVFEHIDGAEVGLTAQDLLEADDELVEAN